jgi:hypothetical protein
VVLKNQTQLNLKNPTTNCQSGLQKPVYPVPALVKKEMILPLEVLN